ncbi:MAG: NAD(P)H-dependent oxidoreductase [Wenzhouxiangellaceae bacterium]|nr:NAD(P)H-dependent oxidoreductase [Wenzhouxiangellaceae bacterium]
MSQPKVLAFAGSTRRASFNRRLLAVAVPMLGGAGADVRHFELADYPMPLFNEDIEAELGQHENATRVRRMMLEADAFMLACPEYNSSITPLMKNVIDWVSRAEDGGGNLDAYKNKRALLLGASPGRRGGARAIATVASILRNIGTEVYPEHFALPAAGDAFGDVGGLACAEHETELRRVVRGFAGWLA